MQRNQKGNYLVYTDEIKRLEFFFFLFYLLEAFLKILGLGLILSKASYLRNGWNILDFIVIIGLILSYSDVFPTFDFTMLRSFRLIGPLRTVTSFKRLQIILSAIFSALPLFISALFILVFCYTLYSIIGLQLFSGILKNRCFDLNTGIKLSDSLCGNQNCGKNSLCIKGIKNINLDVINFDNVFSCFLQVLFVITLDNWTTIMYSIQKSFSNYAWIYFFSLVIFGSYMMNNLLLAIIKVQFSEAQNNLLSGKVVLQKQEEKITFYDFNVIKREGLWNRKKKLEEKNKNKNTPTKPPVLKNELKDYNEVAFPLLNLNLIEDHIQSPRSKYSSSKNLSYGNSIQKSKSSSILSPKARRYSGENHNKTNLKRIYTKDSVFSLISPTHKTSFVGKNSLFSSNLGSFMDQSQKMGNFHDKLLNAFKEIASMQLKKKLLNFFNYSKIKKKKRHSILFSKLRPEYLKLYVDYNKDYENSSENDVLLKKNKKKEAMREIENQMNEIREKKVPFHYTLKKNSGLFNVLEKIYTKNKKSIMNESSFMFDNHRQSDYLKHLKQKSIKKGSKPPQRLLKHITQGIYTKKKSISKIPEIQNENQNVAIQIKKRNIEKKTKTGQLTLAKSIKKTFENFSIRKNRDKLILIDEEEKILKILKGKKQDSFRYVRDLINMPIEIDDMKRNELKVGSNLNLNASSKNELEEEGCIDLAKEYLNIRVSFLLKIFILSY